MSQTKKTVVDVLVIAATLAWIVCWYFQAPLYVYLHDQLLQRWQIHAPQLLILFPVIAVLIWFIWSRLRFTHQHDRLLSYRELVKKLQQRLVLYLVALFVLAALGLQFYSLAHNAPDRDDEVITLSASSLSKSPAESLWMRRVQVQGVAATEQLVVTRDLAHPSWTELQRFVPIIAATASSQANKPAVVHFSAAMSSATSVSPKITPVVTTGYVSWRLLPFSVRQAYRQNGLRVSLFSYVVSSHFTDLAPFYRVCALVFALLAFLVLIRLLSAYPLHLRKLQAAWDYERGYSARKDVREDVFPWSSGRQNKDSS